MRASRAFLALALVPALASAALAAGDPDPVPAAPVRSAYDEGRNQANLGNWDRAVALFRRAVARKPDDHKAFSMLGYSLRKTGRVREALEAYDRALSLKPDYAEALEYRGVAHLKAGDRRAALADYEKLRSLGSPLAAELKEEIDKAAAN